MVDMTNDVIKLEQLFADRFTEKDPTFSELKSKSLPNPVVIYPWRTQRKVWNKRWDYGNRKTQDDRFSRDRGNYRNDGRHGQNSYSRHRDQDNENSRERYRDRSHDSRQERYRDRSHDSRQERYRDHSHEGRQNSRDNSHDHNKPFDFQAALKAYQER